MTTLEARWSQLVFWDDEAVQALHARERAREAQNQKLREERKAPIEWQDLCHINAMATEFGMVPYWGQFTAQDVRTERVRHFLASIWPIWRGAESKHGGEDAEYVWVHVADLAIRRSGMTIDRGVAKRYQESGKELAAGRWHG